ncbi:16S rRNA (adenine(1518)-N(6)/adenine(1519)-N(6))-dimethyltransferase RsmA [Gracilimonas mengyeensis]|uniref:Ribosomal RNA small subunit methyltransferase A n=1 Tax=Gracilimonas mengyeensis TaxID=1302730 RepID=A0A521C2P8_9BACT|nr:16S rRNA (adenine(1518)-N(6)/adenine(1519)-N(6))-dimethyltransferase RsmA [Gracilimonas mengyeensis]SMO53766.1 dimethyladenosine transferase [Gracilimonas mengyeensis]
MSFKTKKSLGQHFLNDKLVIYQIMDAIGAEEADRVIEIGPGTGALTKWLAEKFSDVHAIELDERAIKVLEQEVENVVIHKNDVLKVKWPEMIAPDKKNIVVGNLPYYITSQILFDLLENRELFSEAILMMQKEVAERLVAEPATKEYGILSVQTQLFCSPEILFDVAPRSFTPPPKVTSAVVKLHFDKPDYPFADKKLKSIVRTAFNQRRKKLSNSLKPVLGDDDLPEGFNFDDRAEHWAPDIYAKLAEQLNQSDSLS